MTCSAYMREVLIQIYVEMSELLDKQVNVLKESTGFTQAPASP